MRGLARPPRRGDRVTASLPQAVVHALKSCLVQPQVPSTVRQLMTRRVVEVEVEGTRSPSEPRALRMLMPDRRCICQVQRARAMSPAPAAVQQRAATDLAAVQVDTAFRRQAVVVNL